MGVELSGVLLESGVGNGSYGVVRISHHRIYLCCQGLSARKGVHQCSLHRRHQDRLNGRQGQKLMESQEAGR